MEEKQNCTPTPYQQIANPITDKTIKQNTDQLRKMAQHGRLDFWAEMSKNISWFEDWNTILDDSEAPHLPMVPQPCCLRGLLISLPRTASGQLLKNTE